MSKAWMLGKFNGGSMAQTFLISKNDKKYVRKVAEITKDKLGAEKLKKQWQWLFEFNKMEPRIFPAVEFFVYSSKTCYYDMDYIEMETFKDYLLKNDDIERELLEDILSYGKYIAKPVDSYKGNKDTYIKEKHLEKMVARCAQLKPYGFYTADKININGKEYDNLHIIIKKILEDNELMEVLKPKRWYRSHGDFTFQNILTDGYDVKIIDPRGEGPDSVYYDISKLFQSCHGKYDILDGNFEVWSDGKTDTINYRVFNHLEKFNKMYEILVEMIPKYYPIHNDEHWQIITKFFEASHFISMIPFRLKENGALAALCYAIGIEIFDEMLEEWNSVKSTRKESITV